MTSRTLKVIRNQDTNRFPPSLKVYFRELDFLKYRIKPTATGKENDQYLRPVEVVLERTSVMAVLAAMNERLIGREFLSYLHLYFF